MLALRKFCHLRNSVDNVTYKVNFPTSQILLSFYSLIWQYVKNQVIRSSAKNRSEKCDQNPQKHP